MKAPSSLATRLTVLLLPLMVAGCGALNISAQPAMSWFTLDDKHTRTEPATDKPDIDHALIIGQVDANPFYDSTQLAYARTDRARAYYQYAAWTERPPKRLATLIERRLAARNHFRAVANNTAGIRGDLLLNLALDEIYHDTSVEPQQARLVVHATLINAVSRAMIARKTFTENAPVAEPVATSAVTALNDAATAMIDKMVEWVEQQSAEATKPKPTDKPKKGKR